MNYLRDSYDQFILCTLSVINMNTSKMPLLARTQPPSTIHWNNIAINDSTELLAQILALETILLHIPVIIIYDSTLVHIHHLTHSTTTHT